MIELSLLEMKWDLGREPGRKAKVWWQVDGQMKGGRRGEGMGHMGGRWRQAWRGEVGERAEGEREGSKQGQVWQEQYTRRKEEGESQLFPQWRGWGDTLSPVSSSNQGQKAVLWGWFQQGHYQTLKIKIKTDPHVAWRWIGMGQGWGSLSFAHPHVWHLLSPLKCLPCVLIFSTFCFVFILENRLLLLSICYSLVWKV